MKIIQMIKNIFLWGFAIFCFVGALIYMPSFSAFVFLAVAIGCLPIQPIRKLWNKIPFTPWLVKTATLFVLFFVACFTAPTIETPNNSEVAQVTEVKESNTTDIVDTESESKTEESVEENSEENTENNEEITTAPSESEVEDVIATTEPEVEIPSVSSPEEAAIVSGFDVGMVLPYSGAPYAVVNGNVPFFADFDLSSSSYEYYSAMDRKGRCGVCVASIGLDIMPTEERGEIGSVKPSGWNQAKYAGVVEGNYLYNRCHLIGYQLTGENANEENLITGTRYLNTEGMLPFENMVADYVKETQNHVMYRVSPIFEGDNLLASGVLIEAKSVEDNGDGILFCVYCYNVQPGVSIDYSNGASALIEGTTTGESEEPNSSEDKKHEETSEPTPEQKEPEKEQTPTLEYAVNANNGKIHMVGACSATGTGDNAMKNPVYFNTYEEAEAYSIQIAPSQKKRRCGNCW